MFFCNWAQAFVLLLLVACCMFIDGYKYRRIAPGFLFALPSIAKPMIPVNTQWKEYKLPRSYLAVSVLEAVDMDIHVSEAIDKSLVEPYGLITWYVEVYITKSRKTLQ